MNEFGWTLHEVTPEESEFAEAYTNMDVGPTERILLDPTPGPRTFNGVIKAVHADVMVEIMSHFRSVKCLGDETFFLDDAV